MNALSPGMAELLGWAASRDYDRWAAVARRVHGCSHPVRLIGQAATVDTSTGEIVDSYATADEPTGYLLTRCGNRRATVCPSCSEVYRADTFQLIRAGITGGKGVPDAVRLHPRLFVTLTAPSFGPVHSQRQRDGLLLPCRPRRRRPDCQHGQPLWCDSHHDKSDPLRGQPLCWRCFAYPDAVLWNAHVGQLWSRFTIYLRRELADNAGIRRHQLGRQVRVAFAKVAEYQARGLVHVHALIRLDGPEGGSTPPPGWATADVLAGAITAAAAGAAVPHPLDPGRAFRWGEQLDVRALESKHRAEDERPADERIAAYIAKYATKGAEVAGPVNHRIRRLSDIEHLELSDHARRMIVTCWRLASRDELAGLHLRRWAHMLGYRGHFSTKSRRYSTTLGALRQARTDERAATARELAGMPEPDATATARQGQWRFAGSGYSPGHQLIAGPDDQHRRLAG